MLVSLSFVVNNFFASYALLLCLMYVAQYSLFFCLIDILDEKETKMNEEFLIFNGYI